MRTFKIPEVLTDEERQKLLRIPNKRYPTGLRNYCIMLIIFDGGLRSSEIVNLHMNNINLNNGQIKVVQGKGRKDRILWVNGETLQQLKKWIERKPDSEYVFCTLQGLKLSDSYLRAFFARYGKRAGIKKRVHPHMLRHSFATDLYRQTKDIRLVQKALGHSTISTTMIYTHIVDDDLENGMKNFREKKKREKEALEKIKRLEDEIAELKNQIDKGRLFDY